jgi:hypothetical protein
MKFKAIAFDLLTALVDSWTLWAKVAGSDERGENLADHLTAHRHVGRHLSTL